jgi:hypothetical protein
MEIDSVGGGYDAFIFHKGAVCCPCGAWPLRVFISYLLSPQTQHVTPFCYLTRFALCDTLSDSAYFPVTSLLTYLSFHKVSKTYTNNAVLWMISDLI